VPYYERWVVTASDDSPEVTGYLDWAIHHAPAARPETEVAREALLRCWRGNAANGQEPFEELFEKGLLSSDELTEIAHLAWPHKQICDESYEEFVARTGFDLKKFAATRRREEEEGGF